MGRNSPVPPFFYRNPGQILTAISACLRQIFKPEIGTINPGLIQENCFEPRKGAQPGLFRD